MILHRLEHRGQGGYTTFGAVWSKGEVKQCCFLAADETGREISMQSRDMAYWSDGSLKWTSHTVNTEEVGESITLTPISKEEEIKKGEGEIVIQKGENEYQIDTGELKIFVPFSGALIERTVYQNKIRLHRVYPVFILQRRKEEEEGLTVTEEREYHGEIVSCEIEEAGPLQAVVCFKGNHVTRESCRMPFVIRMYVWYHSTEIKFVHTFLYDGQEERDFLKGMGIRYETVLSGKKYDRHVQFTTDGSIFHEAAVMLHFSHPVIPKEVYQAQMEGKRKKEISVAYQAEKYPEITDSLEETIEQAAKEMPVWNDYFLDQDSAYHYRIRKRTNKKNCCISSKEGRRTSGVMAVSGAEETVLFGIRDFWQKYPSGMEVANLGGESSVCTVWFYSPRAESFDFRHYDTRVYPKTCYEGYDELAEGAYGIGVTSECRIRIGSEIPKEKELEDYGMYMQKPPVFVGTPEYYYQKRAFGYFSLPEYQSTSGAWMEYQLEHAFLYYKQEIENRNWYGLFDYGDVMHTYDPVRHTWKYDIGGYAWQNTELVPTYWLWLYFLRTGREDVYTVAEAMSRHVSEVDLYHFGPLKGLGSRHNVRHWGCPCKEPRIAMAGHSRFLYYLTGDRRLRDIFEEVKDADMSLPYAKGFTRIDAQGKKQITARSGPDWSSFVSNWMTWYEITLDETYRKKIETGILDIKNTPYGFASGPDYDYQAESGHLIYRGEIEDTPNQHLQLCMGGPQIWLEAADILEDDTLKQLLADLGAFYYLSPEEKSRRTNGQIEKRPFSWPMFAAGVAAFSAGYRKDEALGRKVWSLLFQDNYANGQGYETLESNVYAKGSDPDKVYRELPWITTNRTSQWCLNVIMALEFAKEYIPKH